MCGDLHVLSCITKSALCGILFLKLRNLCFQLGYHTLHTAGETHGCSRNLNLSTTNSLECLQILWWKKKDIGVKVQLEFRREDNVGVLKHKHSHTSLCSCRSSRSSLTKRISACFDVLRMAPARSSRSSSLILSLDYCGRKERKESDACCAVEYSQKTVSPQQQAGWERRPDR